MSRSLRKFMGIRNFVRILHSFSCNYMLLWIGSCKGAAGYRTAVSSFGFHSIRFPPSTPPPTSLTGIPRQSRQKSTYYSTLPPTPTSSSSPSSSSSPLSPPVLLINTALGWNKREGGEKGGRKRNEQKMGMLG